MIIRKEETKIRGFDKCHGGSIGEHLHQNDEELYIILDGSGVMKIDGTDEPVKSGDICITRTVRSHSLLNTGTKPMHFLVIGVVL